MSRITEGVMVKEISVDEIKPGMVILRTDKEWLKLPFFGNPIENLDVVKILKNYGVKHVFINALDSESLDLSFEDEENKIVDNNIEKHAASIEEVRKTQRLHQTTLEIVSEMINDVRNGKEIFYEDFCIIIEQLLDECFKKPNLIASITRIKNNDDYEISHATNVAILNIVLARKIGMDIEEMKLAGVGGLLHDIGKTKIPKEILNKPGKLTEEEYKIVKKHPIYGAEILKGRFPKGVIDCVTYHHEKADGSGYPFNLKDMQIPKLAKITAVSDVYDALTSDKVYRSKTPAPQAIAEMLRSAGLQFNNIIIRFFVEALGGYPSGTLVLLDTGELAVVFKENHQDPQFPLVIVVTDKNQKPVTPYLFDLKEYNLLTKKYYKTILTALDSKKYNIDPNKIIESFLSNTSMEERYG